LFCSYLRSAPETPTTPFCDLPISAESSLILPHLLALNSPERQYWTVGSQPAVDGVKSEDPVHGWGPKGGWVFQKAFVEFFVNGKEEVEKIKRKVEQKGGGWVSFYAGNRKVSNLSLQLRCLLSNPDSVRWELS
jgi:methylenetetrahydrofolate reductase (NADPH)